MVLKNIYYLKKKLIQASLCADKNENKTKSKQRFNIYFKKMYIYLFILLTKKDNNDKYFKEV